MAECQPRESSAYRGRVLTQEIWELKERSSLFYHMTIFKHAASGLPARTESEGQQRGGARQLKISDWTMAVREPKSYSETKPLLPFEFL